MLPVIPLTNRQGGVLRSNNRLCPDLRIIISHTEDLKVVFQSLYIQLFSDTLENALYPREKLDLNYITPHPSDQTRSF